MELIENMIFEGERPLYKSIKVEIKNSEFLAGESAIKESKKIKIENCNFHSKYPFWHNKEIEIQESFFWKERQHLVCELKTADNFRIFPQSLFVALD